MSKIGKSKNKRAQGHVEMIVSFVIFVGFVVTLLVILNPLKARPISGTLLDVTQDTIFDNWTVSYSLSSVTLKDSVLGDANAAGCFSTSSQPFGSSSGLVIVEDEKGNSKSFSLTAASLHISHTAGNKFYKLYFSDKFNPGSTLSCSADALAEADYTFGAITSQKAVLRSAMESFVDKYNSGTEGYNELRDELGLQNDFSVIIFNMDKTEFARAERTPPEGAQVVARDIPVITVDEDAVRETFIINLRAW